MAASGISDSISARATAQRGRSIAAVAGVILLALVLGNVLSVFPYARAQSATGLEANLLETLATSLSFIGMAVSGIVYIKVTDRGWEYIDLSRPTKESWKYIALGTLGGILLTIAFNILVIVGGLSASQSQVTESIGTDSQMLLFTMLVVVLFNSPAEEFLFRNIVQKRLGEAFSVHGAILVTSLLFSSLHLPAYTMTGAPLSHALTPLIMVFGGSVFFGYLYAHTRELFVVTGVHALYNLVQLTLYFTSVTAA